MQPSPSDQPLRRNPTFLAMVAFGVIGLLVLVCGLGLYLYYEPVGQNTGTAVQVTGIRQYDPSTNTVAGRSKTVFASNQIPAAVIDWSGVSPGLKVEAGWYDEQLSNAAALNTAGPAPASSMPRAVPLVTQRDQLSPGLYLFIVGRYSGGRIVEVLARQEAQVT
ncbi:MAG: hypothetical protein ACREQM_08860 [Candidatus Dormibacteraceae bacterium]